MAIVLVGLFLAASLLGGIASGLPAFSPGARSAPTPHSSAAPAPAPTAVAPIHPQAGVQRESGIFYENNTTFANLPLNRSVCQHNSSVYNSSFTSPPYTYYDNILEHFGTCYTGAQSPSTLSLGGNEIGVGYSVLSNQSMVGCSNTPDVETSQVAFKLSPDAGANFGPAVWIGNTSCAYLQALEPSFALSSNGNIYGAFVEANYGNATNITFPFSFANRSTDALAFTTSTTAGASFSVPVTLTNAGVGNISRPEVGVFGDSIYIVYENIDNNSAVSLPTSYPYSPAHPIALEVLTSVDGGTTWTGPVTLPGLNASAGFHSMSPSIAVSSQGKVAVAYATNRTCFQVNVFGPCGDYGENIVVSTSTTNGTSWVGPVVVSPNVTGEFQCAGWLNATPPNYWNGCYASLYQWEPTTSVAWSDASPNDVYVTWAGAFGVFNASDLVTSYGASAVFAAASNDGGAAWNDSTVAQNLNFATFSNPAFYYNPVVGVRNGWVYVSWAEENDTYCNIFPCGPGSYGSSYWIGTSLNGVAWFKNVTLLLWDPNPYAYYAFVGYSESIGFSSGGPVVTFSQPGFNTYTFYDVYTSVTIGYINWFNETYWENETGFADLTTAFVWSGNTTVVNFTRTGLPAGTQWNFSLGSASFSSTSKTIQVTNVPVGLGLPLVLPYIGIAFWTRWAAFASVNSTPVFSGPTNVTLAYLIEYGVQFLDRPLTNPFFEVEFLYQGTYYYTYNYGGCSFCTHYASPEIPWYFPIGTVLQITSNDVYSAFPISYWTGTGNGSSNNFGNSTMITVDGPINETAWGGAYGTYNVTFSPVGLPSGTPYNFTFDGTAHSGISPANVTLSSIVTGAYAVSGIVAPGPSGYEYFGQVQGGNEVYVPASPLVLLNFSFAYVNVGSAPGVVAFHATGLAAGDPWALSFNGTAYTSVTPWINVTTRPGTFAVSAAPVEAAFNNTAEYQASGVGPTQSVTIGSTYTVTYSPTYRVVVVAGTGGSATGAGSHWLAPGTLATYTEHTNANYVFLGWTGTGLGSYTGTNPNASVTVNGPITESANFQALNANRFNLTVTETGLAPGTWWTVALNGVGYSTTGSTLLIPNLFPCGAGGQYTVAVPTSYPNGTSGIRFVPSGVPASTCTTGTTQITLTFAEEFLVTPVSTAGGTATVQVNGVPQSTPAWIAAGATAGIQASVTSGYAFSGWLGQGPGNYTGPALTDELTPTGPVTEVATFTLVIPPPPPVYTVSFHAASGLVVGTPWSLTFNGTHYASTTTWINVSGLEAHSYQLVVPTTYSTDKLTEFTPSSPPTSLNVDANLTNEVISFTVSYYVSVQATQGGTVVSPSSGFVLSGKTVQLNASATPGYSFVGWTGTGTSSYTGSTAVTSFVLSGPVTEVASFAPIPAAAPSSSGFGPNSTTLLIALAVVGLVVGLAVGYAVFRRRAPARPSPEGGAP
ncbi:MAG: hypothetical protein L3K10_05795 [Thermoplasmata archaeon]|nr:hypothetical protein [Thermoplasmata archaeon]